MKGAQDSNAFSDIHTASWSATALLPVESKAKIMFGRKWKGRKGSNKLLALKEIEKLNEGSKIEACIRFVELIEVSMLHKRDKIAIGKGQDGRD